MHVNNFVKAGQFISIVCIFKVIYSIKLCQMLNWLSGFARNCMISNLHNLNYITARRSQRPASTCQLPTAFKAGWP